VFDGGLGRFVVISLWCARLVCTTLLRAGSVDCASYVFKNLFLIGFGDGVVCFFDVAYGILVQVCSG
jgi:hypothetical protein